MKNSKRFVINFLGLALLIFVSYISIIFSSSLVVLASEYEYVQNEKQSIMLLKEENEIIDNINQHPYLYHPSSITSFYFSSNRDSENLDGIHNIVVFDDLEFLFVKCQFLHVFRGRYILGE